MGFTRMVVGYLRMLAGLFRVAFFMRIGGFAMRFGGFIMVCCCLMVIVFGHCEYSRALQWPIQK